MIKDFFLFLFLLEGRGVLKIFWYFKNYNGDNCICILVFLVLKFRIFILFLK